MYVHPCDASLPKADFGPPATRLPSARQHLPLRGGCLAVETAAPRQQLREVRLRGLLPRLPLRPSPWLDPRQ